jgi:hypothetical protein
MIATRVPSEADHGSLRNIEGDLHMIIALCNAITAGVGTFPYFHKVDSMKRLAAEIIERCEKIETEQERLRTDTLVHSTVKYRERLYQNLRGPTRPGTHSPKLNKVEYWVKLGIDTPYG